MLGIAAPLAMAFPQQQRHGLLQAAVGVNHAAQAQCQVLRHGLLRQSLQLSHHLTLHLTHQGPQVAGEGPAARLTLQQGRHSVHHPLPQVLQMVGEHGAAHRTNRPPLCIRSMPHRRSPSQARNCFTAAPR